MSSLHNGLDLIEKAKKFDREGQLTQAFQHYEVKNAFLCKTKKKKKLLK